MGLHSLIVLVSYLRVNGLKKEWRIDLPELTSIRLGDSAFYFKYGDSTELIMRSDDDEMKWWIDLPKLTSLTGSSRTFLCPRIITLEGISFHSILTNRHALSHQCHSWQGRCFQIQENHSYQESFFLLSLIPRHHSCSSILSPVHCFFHTPIPSQHQIAVFTSHNNYSLPSSLSLYSYRYIARHATKHSFKPILSFHSNSRDQSKHFLC